MSARIAPGQSRVATRIAVGAVALIVVAAAVLALGYREAYNVWPGQAADARVHWCGRDYENSRGTPLTRQQMSAHEPFPVRLVAHYPPLGWSRQDLFAAVTPLAQRDSVSPPTPCAIIVFLRTGPDAYQVYTLEGGP